MAETLKVTDEAQRTACTLKQNNSWIRIRPLFLFIIRECASGETVGWWLYRQRSADNTYTRNMYIVKH